MATKKRSRRRGRGAASSTKERASAAAPRSPASPSLPEIPALDGSVSSESSDAALAALEQAERAAAPAPDAGDDAGTSPTSGASSPAETALSTQSPAPADAGAPTRDRSPDKQAPAPGKKSDKPKPIALEARELKGLQTSELRTLLVTERRRNAELTARLQTESPIAQAALDKDLQEAIGETFGLVGDSAAFFTGYPECKFPTSTRERLGRVWAPIAKKYMQEYAEHVPLLVAGAATLAALTDRAAAVKVARDERRALEAEQKKNGTLPPAA